MALYLVQHGLSAAKDDDPERGLTEEGTTETERIAQVARGYSIHVEKVVHSGKKRAEQTAMIYHDTLSVNAAMEVAADIGPLDDVRVFAETAKSEKNMMVVGHLPYMERLVSYLVTGSNDLFIYKFQNSGIVCLDQDQGDDKNKGWFIKWTLNPNIS